VRDETDEPAPCQADGEGDADDGHSIGSRCPRLRRKAGSDVSSHGDLGRVLI
jgi:hypothetical protein